MLMAPLTMTARSLLITTRWRSVMIDSVWCALSAILSAMAVMWQAGMDTSAKSTNDGSYVVVRNTLSVTLLACIVCCERIHSRSPQLRC